MAVLAGAAFVAIARPLTPDPNEVCGGITREVGGCDPDQPSYSARTCAGVGREIGDQLNRRSLAIIDGPAGIDGESRGVRLVDQAILVIQRANQYLRDKGMVAECDADEVLAAAETQFSQELKSRVGDHLYAGQPASYDDWRRDIIRALRVIDDEENAPFLPGAS